MLPIVREYAAKDSQTPHDRSLPRPAGPVAGALTLFLADELVLQRWFPVFHVLWYGGAIVLAVLYLPRGLLGRGSGAAGPSTPHASDR